MKSSKSFYLGPQALLVALGLAVSPGVSANRTTDALNSLDARIQRLERALEGEVGLPQMLIRLDALEQENRALRGKLEELNYMVEQLNQRGRELYLDHDKRLQQLETRPHGSSGTSFESGTIEPSPETGISTSMAPGVSTEAPQLDEQTQYRQSFDLLKNGQYDSAAQSFLLFIQQFPSSGLVANAQYWLGEAYYGSGSYAKAVSEFEKVRSVHPSSPKIPDASLKLGYSYYELKQWSNARQVLNEIVQNFPGSTVAKLADERLRRMQREGH
ncbi:MAG: tol-pal system protein YbgF [Thiotrichales bacterium]